MVVNAFGVYLSITSRLWHRFQTTRTTRDARGGHALLRVKSVIVGRMNVLMVEDERTLSRSLKPNSIKFDADLPLTMKWEIVSLNLHCALIAFLLSFSAY